MIAYKGFNSDLTCTLGKGKFQYKEGVTYREGEANCVKNGFHAAENPLDCLTYYPDWDSSVYYEVEAVGDIDEDGRDSKIACTELTLVKKLGLIEFTRAAVEYMVRHPLRSWLERKGRVEVRKETGCPESGKALIIRGKNPKIVPVQTKAYTFTDKPGIVALVREKADSPRIEEARLYIFGLLALKWDETGNVREIRG